MNLIGKIKTAGKIAYGTSLSLFDRDLGKKYLYDTLSSIPGITAKTAQLLSLKLDLDESNQIKIPEIPPDEIKKLIAERCQNLADAVSDVKSPAKVASIGQVNQIKLKNSKTLAVKTQFPGIKESIKSQIDTLFFGVNFGPPKKYGLNVKDYNEYFSNALAREVDYTEEAKIQKYMYKTYLDSSLVKIPNVYEFYSSDTILAQEWIDSTPPSQTKNWKEMERVDCCEKFIRYFLDAIFNKKILHMDLHKNNYGFSKNGSDISLVLYDFGSILKLDSDKVQCLYEIICHFMHTGKSINLIDHMIYLGFDAEKLKHIAPQIPTIVEKLISPLLSPTPWSPGTWGLKDHIESVLQEKKWWFRTAGPAWFLMLMRSAQGLLTFLDSHGYKYFISNIFSEVIKNYNPINIKVPHVKAEEFETLSHHHSAKYLKVKVDDQGEEIILSSLPYRVIDEIEDFIPEESLTEIKKEIDLEHIVSSVKKSGYLPQVVFEKTLQNKRHYKVWLE